PGLVRREHSMFPKRDKALLSLVAILQDIADAIGLSPSPKTPDACVPDHFPRLEGINGANGDGHWLSLSMAQRRNLLRTSWPNSYRNSYRFRGSQGRGVSGRVASIH